MTFNEGFSRVHTDQASRGMLGTVDYSVEPACSTCNGTGMETVKEWTDEQGASYTTAKLCSGCKGQD